MEYVVNVHEGRGDGSGASLGVCWRESTCAEQGVQIPQPPRFTVTFANGALPGTALGESTLTDLHLTLHQQVGRSSKRRRRIMVANPSDGETGVHFAGKNYGDGGSRNLVQYAVGVVDDTTGTMDVFPVDTSFCMRPDLRVSAGATAADTLASASKARVAASTAGAETLVDARAAAETRKQLVNEFGSKLKQKQYRSRDANVIDARAVAGGGAVHAALADSAAAAAAAAAGDEGGPDAEATEKWMLPPFNKDASTPAEAYPAGTVVPPLLGRALAGTVADMVKVMKDPVELDTWLREARIPGFVGYFVKRAASSEAGLDRKAVKNVARMATCVSALLTLFDAPGRLTASASLVEQSNAPAPDAPEDAAAAASSAEGEAQEAAEGASEAAAQVTRPKWTPPPGLTLQHASAIPSLKHFSEDVAVALLQCFAEKQAPSRPGGAPVYRITKQLRNKLLLHIGAVLLHLEGFSFPLTVLARRLRMVQKALLKFFVQLGCSYKSSRKEKRRRGEDPESSNPEVYTEYTVTLDVPLTFPSVTRGKARK